MLSKLHEVESLRGLLPFVRSAHSRPSMAQWRQIRQSEGGEQGDPLMPLLFCLAMHDVFVKVCALSTPEQSRDLYDLLDQKLHDVAGIRLHTGKTSTWNRAGAVPERMAELGPSVWSPGGLKILGTPLGTPEFHSIATRERLEEETLLWRAIPWVPDLQCSWQLLVQCAGPRCHHFLRCVPPELSKTCAEEHDRGMMEVMGTLLEGLPGDLQQQHEAAQLATLPMRMRGLGLRPGQQFPHDPGPSSWDRWYGCPPIGVQGTSWLLGFSSGLVHHPTQSQSLVAAWLATQRVFISRTPLQGGRSLCPVIYWNQAQLRSHSGPGASAVLCGAPTAPEFTLTRCVRIVVFERLRLPLQITESHCECGTLWTRWDTTRELFPGLGGCEPGQWHQKRGHWPESAGRRAQLCDGT